MKRINSKGNKIRRTYSDVIIIEINFANYDKDAENTLTQRSFKLRLKYYFINYYRDLHSEVSR